jgi:hypothetical protein
MVPVLNFDLLKRLCCFGYGQTAGFIFANKYPALVAKLIVQQR